MKRPPEPRRPLSSCGTGWGDSRVASSRVARSRWRPSISFPRAGLRAGERVQGLRPSGPLADVKMNTQASRARFRARLPCAQWRVATAPHRMRVAPDSRRTSSGSTRRSRCFLLDCSLPPGAAGLGLGSRGAHQGCVFARDRSSGGRHKLGNAMALRIAAGAVAGAQGTCCDLIASEGRIDTRNASPCFPRPSSRMSHSMCGSRPLTAASALTARAGCNRPASINDLAAGEQGSKRS